MSSFWGDPIDEKPTYRTAQVCLNGHTATDRLEESPESAERYCSMCGSPTISACPSCDAGIRGDYHVPGVAAIGFKYSPPNHCYNCGSPFPWTTAKIAAAKEMADELDLSDQDRETLKGAIVDLSTDSPKTELAAHRFNRIAKAGKGVAEFLRPIVVDLATDAAKKLISGI